MEDLHLKILYVGEKDQDFELLRTVSAGISAAGVDVDWISDYHGALRMIRKGLHDVYIVNYHQTDRSAIELLKDAKAGGHEKPFILLTEQCVDARDEAEAIQSGAADYLVKEGVNSLLLEKSINYSLQQKRIQGALKDSEKRFHFVARNTGDAFYHLRYDTMSYDYLSPAITTLTGYNADEIAKIGFSQLVKRIDLPGQKDVSKEFLVKERREGRTGQLRADYLICAKNGEWKWLRDHSFPWLDDSGELLGSTGILSDVTELKTADESLRESERQLRFLSAKLLTVQEEEKTRLAGLLHDSFGQTLIALKFGVETAIHAAKAENKSIMLETLQHLVPMVQNSMEELRKTYMMLRPTILDDFGIIAAVEWYCREFEKIHNDIHVEICINIVEKQVPQHLKIVIFRIFQEAMQNAFKHSNAKRVRVILRGLKKKIELSIQDNGKGFDPKMATSPDSPHKGVGLASMKERASLSGGSFRIRSGKRTGTTVKVTWSLT